MIPDLERAVKSHNLWFGSYKRSGDFVKVQVWLTVNNGCIEFLTSEDSFKVKRVRANPHVVCNVGSKDGPALSGTAEIVIGRDAAWRVYRAYWKAHPLVMLILGLPIRMRIKRHKQILIRVCPDEPNPFAGVTDPPV